MSTPARPAHFQGWRYLVVYALLGGMAVIFLVRLLGLQLLNGKSYTLQAEDNRTEVISVAPSRGTIYDRNGIILARNIASYNIIITPAELPDDSGDIQRIYRELSALTGVPVSHGTVEDAKLIAPCVPGPGIAEFVELGDSNAPYDPVKIQCNVDEQVAMSVREHAIDWPGVDVQIEPVRDYPTGSLTANIIGYVGPIWASLEQEYRARGFLPNRDKIGYAGVENSLNDILIGTPGQRTVEVDVAGQVLRNVEAPVDPIPGNNVILTIDTRLQQAAESILKRDIDYWNNDFNGYMRITSGVVIAMNPKTGEIIEYLLPRFTNVRRVFVDNSTTPVTFWVGNNHGASIVKLEPLD